MKIKILYFLPNFIFGGAGNSIVRLCNFLPKKEFDVTIISIGKCFYRNELKKNNINLIEINSSRLIFSIRKLRDILLKVPINKFKKIIFVSNIHYVNVISLMFLRNIKNIKIIVTERTSVDELRIFFSFKEFIKKKIIFKLIKMYYKKADCIISNSKTVSKDLSIICKKEVVTIHPPSIKKINKKFKKFQKNNNILFVGRLSIEKNIFCLLNALKLIKHIDYKVFIVGDGPQYNSAKNFIIDNNLDKKIFLEGKKLDINPYLKSASIFINCSYFEGLPNSLVEAANFNIPIIASKSNSGTNEIILNGKGGTLFPVNDHNKLSSILINFFNNKKQFIKKTKKAKSKIDRFTYQQSFSKYKDLFRNI